MLGARTLKTPGMMELSACPRTERLPACLPGCPRYVCVHLQEIADGKNAGKEKGSGEKREEDIRKVHDQHGSKLICLRREGAAGPAVSNSREA